MRSRPGLSFFIKKLTCTIFGAINIPVVRDGSKGQRSADRIVLSGRSSGKVLPPTVQDPGAEAGLGSCAFKIYDVVEPPSRAKNTTRIDLRDANTFLAASLHLYIRPRFCGAITFIIIYASGYFGL